MKKADIGLLKAQHLIIHDKQHQQIDSGLENNVETSAEVCRQTDLVYIWHFLVLCADVALFCYFIDHSACVVIFVAHNRPAASYIEQ